MGFSENDQPMNVFWGILAVVAIAFLALCLMTGNL
jgi:hypothetical protein